MLVVYVAGPFTDDTPWLIEQNVRWAEESAISICMINKDVVALCPHSMYRFANGLRTPEYWYEATLEMLRRCDAVFLLDGWEDSVGSVKEKEEAERLGIPIFHQCDLGLSRLSDWADQKDH